MGERCENAWIFMHQSVIEKLADSNLLSRDRDRNDHYIYNYQAGESITFSSFGPEEWYVVLEINTRYITFKEIGSSEELKCIIKLKMEF